MTDKTVYKTLEIGKIEKASDQDMSLTFTISSGMKDRDGDIVTPEGMQATSFATNPVMLWSHDYLSLPVAKSVNLWRDAKGIKAKAQFQPDSNYHPSYTGIRGSMVYNMYRTGFLNAVSIGFSPLEYEPLTEKNPNGKHGTHFKRWELLEFSAVPVPSNAAALVDRSAQKAFTKALKGWAEDAQQRCEDCETVLVDTEMLADEIYNAVKAIDALDDDFRDNERLLVDTDVLADELYKATRGNARRSGSGYLWQSM
jgi:HK97 family phage prohead protease